MFGCREAGEDADSQGDGSSQPDTISIASRTSQNTVDSDKVQTHRSDLDLWRGRGGGGDQVLKDLY